ncbi:MAG TPA: TrmH family RNA methyltransferase [Candidatus Polarisedimenticolia bacterium]|nr:TrmH family RNA methyltransferase [Candidatus Polarisedimenticolia bacterium]
MPTPSEFDGLCVVLVSTRNPLNIGAAARAMSNLGFLRLRVVNPYEASFREARSAVGAAPLLAKAEEYSSLAAAVADCSLVIGTTAGGNREPHHPLRLLKEAARLVRKRLCAGGRVALLFGSEKRGLANEDLSYCHWLLHIPTREEHVSMNLGQAVAVCLYELAHGSGVANPAKNKVRGKTEKLKPATAGELERITTILIDALRASGYLGQRSVAAKEEKIRRMVRRLELSSADSEVWLGMLRQMLWKMKPTNDGQ